MNPQKKSNWLKKFPFFKKSNPEKENPDLEDLSDTLHWEDYSQYDDVKCRLSEIYCAMSCRVAPTSPVQPLFSATELANILKTKTIATYTRVAHGQFISYKDLTIF